MTPCLWLDRVSVQLGGRDVVRDVTASFSEGELVALLGPNGAGKTSLLRAAVGLIGHTGAIELLGESASALPILERARRIGYLPQGHVAHWPLPVRDIVALGRYPHGARDPQRLAARDRAAVDAALGLTDTQRFAARLITELSGGERARVALARVLAVEAPIILADEPTAALDPHYQIEMMERLRQIADAGTLVIAVTHDLALASRFCDRVLVLDAGRLVADGPVGEALGDDILGTVFRIEVVRATRDGRTAPVPWVKL